MQRARIRRRERCAHRRADADCGGADLDGLDGVLDLEEAALRREGVYAAVVLAPSEEHLSDARAAGCRAGQGDALPLLLFSSTRATRACARRATAGSVGKGWAQRPAAARRALLSQELWATTAPPSAGCRSERRPSELFGLCAHTRRLRPTLCHDTVGLSLAHLSKERLSEQRTAKRRSVPRALSAGGGEAINRGKIVSHILIRPDGGRQLEPPQ